MFAKIGLLLGAFLRGDYSEVRAYSRIYGVFLRFPNPFSFISWNSMLITYLNWKVSAY